MPKNKTLHAKPAGAATPAAPGVPSDAMVDAYLQAQRHAVEEADRLGRPNIGGLHTNTVREACRSGLKAALAAAHQPPAAAPAPGVERDDLAELSMLNRLIDLGAKAAGFHATSNSDDGHKGTAAYVQWQETRAQMGELIRSHFAAAHQPPTAAPQSLRDEIQRLAQFADTATRMGNHADVRNNMETLAEELTRLSAAPQPAVTAGAVDALKEIVGCIDSANAEGLDDALINNTDSRLADLVQRRLLPAFYVAIAAQRGGA